MDSNELLPCPFCGSAVSIRRDSGNWGYTSAFLEIACPNKCAKFAHDAEGWDSKRGVFSIEEEAKNAVVTRWNTRASFCGGTDGQ